MHEPTSADSLPRVLIVDDEQPILRALQRELRGQPFTVVAKCDPLEALAAVREQSFDLVISDNRMPGMTGIELLEQVRALSPDTVRIMLTGYTDLESAVSAINKSEIHRYIAKPWEKAELLTHIGEALEVHRLRRLNRELNRELAEKNALLANTNEALRALATRDRMTGLYNHAEFQVHLERRLKLFGRDGQPFCLVLGDIDNFKQINDTYGHPAGDAVIKAVAHLLHTTLRDEVDTVYRYGGEEFAILLRNTDETGVGHALERVLAGIRTLSFDLGGRARGVTMSFGAAKYCAPCSQEAFVASVDRALYAAKGAGKDCWVLAEPGEEA